jgi:hypothetical protein
MSSLAFGGVDGDGDGAGAVRRADAGRHAFARFDRSCEGGFVPGAIGTAHQFKAQLIDAPW